MESLLHILDLTGTAVFAITGALAAGRKRMDVFGVIVLGCVTALGGGTLRDLVLGVRPVFWVSDSTYLGISAAAGLLTFILAQRTRLPSGLLLYADSLGLAVFTVIGFQKGFQITGTYSTGIVTGIATGVAGGIIRDVLSGEIPLIFRKEIYASASFCGALLFGLLVWAGIPEPIPVCVAFLTTLIVRVTALRFRLSLPLFRPKVR